MDTVRLLLNEVDFDIVGVTETWLKQHISDVCVKLNGFNCFRNDRALTKAGGICMYIRVGLSSKVLYMSSTPNLEIMLVEVVLQSTKLLVCLVYKPPQKVFLNELNDVLQQFAIKYKDVIIFGDFNTNMLNCSINTRRFSSMLMSYDLEIFNRDPTYFYGKSGSLIDLVITSTNKINFFNQLGVGCFDHDLLFWIYNSPNTDSSRTIFYRDYNHIDVNGLLFECAKLQWDNLYNLHDVNLQLYLFNELVVSMFDKYVPLRSLKIKNKRPPWFTREILNCMNLREYALSKWKADRKPESRRVFMSIRNKITAMIRAEKARCLNSMFDSELSQKKFWSFMNKAGCSSAISVQNSNFSANEFSNEFAKSDHCQVNINCNSNTFLSYSRDSELSFKCIDDVTLLRVLYSVKGESTGLDGIPIKFIKLIFPVIHSFLLFIINNMITASCFPDDWKLSKVIPIPKTKNPIALTDFRPVSILPSLSKVFEKILKEQVTEHLNKHKLLDDYQSAYRKGHSTSSAVLHIVDDLRRSADSGKATILVLLDFSKAFDCIIHSNLIRKLYNNFLFSSSACKLMESYLCNRRFTVFDNMNYSDIMTTSRGVPQGSVLGPLLFSLYINDLPSVIQNCKYHLFADDVQIYIDGSLSNLVGAVRCINITIDAIDHWATQNGLKLNPKKTQSIVVYKHILDTSNCPPVSVCNENIPFSDCVKNLGILINKSLSWDEHVNSICSKTYMKLRCLWTATDFAGYDLRRKLFMAYILPYFSYGEVILYGMHQYNLDKLNYAFKACVRYIYRLRKYDHISLVLPNVIGCSLSEYYTFRTCFLFYKLLKKETPSYLFNKLNMSSLSRNKTLIIPRNYYNIFNSSFYVKGVGCWNSLPSAVKSASSSASFKKLYFSYMFGVSPLL